MSGGRDDEACMMSVALKIFVERRKRPTVHRMRGVRTFGELTRIVCELLGTAGRVTVQYDDEDGDRITVASAREWDEALRLHTRRAVGADGRELPLKVTVRRRGAARARAGCDGEAASQRIAGDEAASDDDAVSCEDAVAAARERSCAADINPADCREPSPASDAGVVADAAAASVPPLRFAREVDAHIMTLLSALYERDVAAELLRAEPTIAFGDVLSHTYDAVTGGVDVEVNLDALARAVHVAAMSLLDQLDAARAVELLEAACVVYPLSATMHYNAACALAMCGRRDDAVTRLEHAVRLGYRDAERMERDPDLASVHDERRFRSLLRSMRGPAASVRPSMRVGLPAVSQDALTLVSVFPNLSADDAEALLRRCGGSVQAAVNTMLGGL